MEKTNSAHRILSGKPIEWKFKETKILDCVIQLFPGSIPGASRFSEKQWVWNGVHSAS
jgi:hypothetical protein